MDAVFLKVFNMSVAAGWLVLAVVLLRLVLKKAPKALRCVLWSIVGVRLVLPFSIESVLSLIPSTETLPPETLFDANPAVNTGFSAMDNTLNPLLLNPLWEMVSPIRVVIWVAEVVWIVGIVAMLLYSVISYSRLRHRVGASVRLKGNVWLCDQIASPFILGIVKPRIYLPSNIEEQTMDYVVAHENAHLKRRDHWWKPLGFALLALHWFNPLMWVAYILLCRDIELACDERVIKQMDTEHKKAYSEALLSCSVPRRMVAVCPLAFGEVSVKNRIKAALHYKKPAFWLIMVAVVATIVVTVGFLTDPPTTVDEKPPSTRANDAVDTNSNSTDYESYHYSGKLAYNNTSSALAQTADTMRQYRLVEKMMLQEYQEDTQSWQDIGEMTSIVLDEENFESRLNQEYWTLKFSTTGLQEDNNGAWELKVERNGRKELYIYLQQFNSPHQLCYGYYDIPSGADNADSSLIRWVYMMDWPPSKGLLHATVLEVKEHSLLVEPFANETEWYSTDRIEVSTKVISSHPVPEVQVGDIVRILYNGEIQETYPVQITKTYAILLAEGSSVSDVGGVDGPQNVEVSTERTYICVDSPEYEDPYLHSQALHLQERDHTFSYKEG